MKRPAQIFDVDGTLANVDPILKHIVNYDNDLKFKKNFDNFHKASIDVTPHFEVVEMLRQACDDRNDIIIVTARRETWRANTSCWLAKWNIPHNALFMRKNDDYRKDYEVKKDILADILQFWDVKLAVDDNPNVIALWQEYNIPTIKWGNWDGVDRT